MARKTYYTILGVSSTESPSGIRAAYRELAKKLHPDVAGEHATRSFQEVSEAYAVLSDPQRRREYNRELSRSETFGTSQVQRAPPEPVVRRQPVPTRENVESLDFEVLLTPEEASRGCVVPVGVPVFRRCPGCRGLGRVWGLPCPSCGQRGMLEDSEPLEVRLPPGVRSGSVHQAPLWRVGIHEFNLRLHVVVVA